MPPIPSASSVLTGRTTATSANPPSNDRDDSVGDHSARVAYIAASQSYQGPGSNVSRTCNFLRDVRNVAAGASAVFGTASAWFAAKATTDRAEGQEWWGSAGLAALTGAGAGISGGIAWRYNQRFQAYINPAHCPREDSLLHGFLSPSFYRVAVEGLPQTLHVDAVDDFRGPPLPPQPPRVPSVSKGRPVTVPPSPPVVEGDGKTTGGFPALEDLGARDRGPAVVGGSKLKMGNVLALARSCADRWDCFGRPNGIPELDDMPDVWDDELFARRFGVGRNRRPARSDRIDDWVDGWGDMSGLAGKKKAAFGVATADLCLGAAVLTRGCKPQRYTPRVYTFSTDVQEIQRQQLMIGACLVSPAVAMYAVGVGASVATEVSPALVEGLTTLLQWARPVAAAF